MSLIDPATGPARLDQWLLSHHVNIWAVRFPAVLSATVVIVFLSAVASTISVCFFNGDPDATLMLAAALYLAILFSWGSSQASAVMPDGPRLTRSPGDDVAIAVLAFPLTFLLGCAVFGPLLGALSLERKMEESDKHVQETVQGLQVGLAYFPSYHSVTARILASEKLVERFGLDSRLVQKDVATVVARRDRKRAQADLQRFMDALNATRDEKNILISADIPACAESVLSVDGSAASGMSCSELKQYQIYGGSFGRWSRHVRIVAVTDVAWIQRLVCFVALISLWMAMSLACNTRVNRHAWFLGLAVLSAFPMLFSDTETTGHIAIYSSIALWGIFAAAILALSGAPRLRVVAADSLAGLGLGAIVLIATNLFLPSAESHSVAPHAIAVLILCLLAAPYMNYVRKRAAVAPEQ
jgi:hypothetical protein